MNESVETTSRNLEQYFYANGIRHKNYYKNESYETVWQYERTPWLEEVLGYYGRYLQEKRRVS